MTNAPESRPLDELMTEAQAANSAGNLNMAGVLYPQAYDMAIGQKPPDWLTATRAARGTLEVIHRQGGIHGTVVSYWREETPKALHNTLSEVAGAHGWQAEELLAQTELPPDTHPVLREVIQTGTVLGKLTLRQAVAREQGSPQGRRRVDTSMEEEILDNFRRSGRLLPLVEGDGPIDQYRINWEGAAAFGERLYGSRMRAARIAWQGLWHYRLSESPKLPTSAGQPESYRVEAVDRAKKRALGAVASLVLPRSLVLSMAARAF